MPGYSDRNPVRQRRRRLTVLWRFLLVLWPQIPIPGPALAGMPAFTARIKALLVRGNEVRQMMTVVGEEGTSIEDFTMALKTDFFDNCYLQQNAFDDVDGATPADRQIFVFDKILEVIDLEFDFKDKNEARSVMVRISDLVRNWNYAATDTDEYRELLGQIDRFIATNGREES